MSKLVPANQFILSSLEHNSAEECLVLTKQYLERSAGNYYTACLCLFEAINKMKKRGDKRLDYYDEIGLTKERAAEMFRVAEAFYSCERANVRTYNQSALIQLAGLKKVGKAIVDIKKQISVADLKKLKKKLPKSTYNLTDKTEIVKAVDDVLKIDETIEKSAIKTKTTNKEKIQISEYIKILTEVSDKLNSIRSELELGHNKNIQSNDAQKAGVQVIADMIRTNARKIENIINKTGSN
jgi:hypothetical protein